MSYYDQNSGICCPNDRLLWMRDFDNVIQNFPVEVFDVDANSLGFASDEFEYIALWNGDEDNAEIGFLQPGPYPNLFKLSLIPGQTSPGKVIGVPLGMITEDNFIITTEEGQNLNLE